MFGHSLFNITRDLAGKPLLAAQAYQDIVEALKTAEEAARNASIAATRAFNEVRFRVILLLFFKVSLVLLVSFLLCAFTPLVLLLYVPVTEPLISLLPQAYPGDPENSIVRRASLSLGKSEELRDKGEDLTQRVREQGLELRENERVLGIARNTLLSTKRKLSVLNLGLDLHLSTSKLIVWLFVCA